MKLYTKNTYLFIIGSTCGVVCDGTRVRDGRPRRSAGLEQKVDTAKV